MEVEQFLSNLRNIRPNRLFHKLPCSMPTLLAIVYVHDRLGEITNYTFSTTDVI
jgi:hypothetical protein